MEADAPCYSTHTLSSTYVASPINEMLEDNVLPDVLQRYKIVNACPPDARRNKFV